MSEQLPFFRDGRHRLEAAHPQTEADAFRARVLAAPLGENVRCHVCLRVAAVRRRTLYGSLIRTLTGIYERTIDRPPDDRWLPRATITKIANCNDYSKLALEPWRLVENDLKHNGFWRITQRGIDFIEGRLTIPAAVLTYIDNELIGTDDKLVSIHDLLAEYDGPRRAEEYAKLRREEEEE